MRVSGPIGFSLQSSEVKNNILVPKYYDPAIEEKLASLHATHDLVSVQDLIATQRLEITQGKYIGKIHYGTGPYPYIRTSDIANCEMRSSPKHGVNLEIYNKFAPILDVHDGDVLLVHEGTYLIGTPCLVTKYDTKILYQHHLAKLRLKEGDGLSPPLMMALLLAPIVQRQIRAKQLTSDIIDSIVGRLQEVILPIPKSAHVRNEFASAATTIFEGRSKARLKLVELFRDLDSIIRDNDKDKLYRLASSEPDGSHNVVGFLGDRTTSSSFKMQESDITGQILIPKYYDPNIQIALNGFKDSCMLIPISDLIRDGIVELNTGQEIGKLDYGTGPIPFIRTSDFGNWELKSAPKHSVSPAVYNKFSPKQPIEANDIFIVRDGTYLVGTSTMVTETDREHYPFLNEGGMPWLPMARCL